MPSISIIIAGTDVTSLLGGALEEQIEFSTILFGRGTATFTLYLPDGMSDIQTGSPAVSGLTTGQLVRLYDPDGNCCWAGSVDSWVSSVPGCTDPNYPNFLTVDVTAASMEQVFDRRMTDIDTFRNETAGAIVTALLTKYIYGQEPINAGTVNDGAVTLGTYVTNYNTLTNYLNDLASQGGCYWYVDPESLEFNFITRGSTPTAPFSISDMATDPLERPIRDPNSGVGMNGGGLAREFTDNWTRQDFRDRQWVRLSYAAFAPRIENFISTGIPGAGYSTVFGVGQMVSIVESTSISATAYLDFGDTIGGPGPSAGDTVTIGGVTYTFVSTLDNTQPNQLVTGSSYDAAAAFYAAINALGSGYAGVVYSTPTTANPLVTADPPEGPAPLHEFIQVFCQTPGSFGNTQTVAATGSVLVWRSAFDDSGPTTTVMVGGVDSTVTPNNASVGQLLVDTGDDYYYEYGFTDITPDPSYAGAAAGASVTITYYPIGNDIVGTENSAVIAARAAAENNSGIYEILTDDSSNANAANGLFEAQALLEGYDSLPELVYVEIRKPGLIVGQLISVTMTNPPISGTFLINEIQGYIEPGDPYPRYQLELLSSSRIGTWLALWTLLASTGSSSGGGSGGAGGSIAPSTQDTAVTDVGSPVTYEFETSPATSGAATQANSDLKGDHRSAHMYPSSTGIIPGLGKMIYQGGSIASGALHTLVASSAFFAASDVGRIVTVQAAGASGATLVTTISAFTDNQHVTITTAASQAVSGQIVFVGDENTNSLLGMLVPPGGDGSGCGRLLPIGQYLAAPATLVIPNPESGMFAGQGYRFGSAIVSDNPSSTSPILQLGDGTNQPHSYLLQRLALDANGGQNVCLYFRSVNLMKIEDVSLQGIGVNGLGIGNPSNETLFQEMIFDHVEMLGVEGTIPAGSIGAQLFATGNVEFLNSNIEQLQTGIIFIGLTQAKFSFRGGHIERIGGYAFILSNCQPTIDCDVEVGSAWLGNDVIGGDLRLSNMSPLWTSGAIVDNGFGNKLSRLASPQFSSGAAAAYSTGVDFSGDEWLKVPGLNPDPTFLNGVGAWSGPVAASTISMPGAKKGASMVVTNGYASSGLTFTAEQNTDYLLQVGMLLSGSGQYRVLVYNSSGQYWAGPTVTFNYGSGNYQSWIVERKSIPVTTDTQFTVVIYSSGTPLVVGMVLISESSIVMASDYATTGTGFSDSGSGPTLVLNQDLATGSVYTYSVQTFAGRCFARAVVTTPANTSGFIGIGGDGNTPGAGPMIPLLPGVTAEYVIPLANYPPNSTLELFAFSGGGTVNISDLGVYPIADTELAPFVLTTPYAQMPNALALSGGKLPIGDPANVTSIQSFIQTAPDSANGFIRIIYASNIFWNGTTWTVQNNGSSDWAALVLLNGGVIAFASEVGLTLPTTRTQAQFTAAIRWQVTPAGVVTQYESGGTHSFNMNVGYGVPSISGGLGDLYVDTQHGALYVNATGGSGGWVNFSTVFWTLVAAGQIQTNDQVGINSAPASGFYLTVGGNTQTGGLQVTGATASEPARFDSSKNLISGQIDIGSGTDIKGSGLSSGQILKWNGSEVAGIAAGVSTTVSQVTGNTYSVVTDVTADTSDYVIGVSLGGTIPSGLTLNVLTASGVSSVSASGGNAVGPSDIVAHTVTDGIVTS